MTTAARLIALLTVVGLSSCMAQPFQVLRSGANGGADFGKSDERVRVTLIEDEASYTRVFARLSANQRPASAAPPIDFATDMALLAELGERPSAGYGIKIESVSCAQGTLKVKVQKTSPEPGALVAQVITSPYVLAVTKRCANMKNVEVVE
jgi:hypothetical protein